MASLRRGAANSGQCRKRYGLLWLRRCRTYTGGRVMCASHTYIPLTGSVSRGRHAAPKGESAAVPDEVSALPRS